jgi:hypothetical protein
MLPQAKKHLDSISVLLLPFFALRAKKGNTKNDWYGLWYGSDGCPRSLE